MSERLRFDQFVLEVAEFRKLWRQPAFWQTAALQERALTALQFVFLNVEGSRQDDAAIAFRATVDEFERRRALESRRPAHAGRRIEFCRTAHRLSRTTPL